MQDAIKALAQEYIARYGDNWLDDDDTFIMYLLDRALIMAQYI